MVKKRKAKTKVVYRNRPKKKRKEQKSMFNLGGLMTPIAAMGYGFVREKISDTLANSQLGQKLPVTQFTDEGVMLAALWGVNKIAKPKGIFGSLMRTGKIVEYARIGSTINDVYGNRQIGVNQVRKLG